VEEHVDALWSKVLEEWEDDKRHKAFLSACAAGGVLAEAARRYRAIAEPRGGSLVSNPSEKEDDSESPYRVLSSRREDAKKRLAAITVLAMSNLEASRSNDEAPRLQKGLRVFAALFLLAALIGLAWAFSLGK
jgi:hypothetical protein